jgi:hypothetical protein
VLPYCLDWLRECDRILGDSRPQCSALIARAMSLVAIALKSPPFSVARAESTTFLPLSIRIFFGELLFVLILGLVGLLAGSRVSLNLILSCGNSASFWGNRKLRSQETAASFVGSLPGFVCSGVSCRVDVWREAAVADRGAVWREPARDRDLELCAAAKVHQLLHRAFAEGARTD